MLVVALTELILSQLQVRAFVNMGKLVCVLEFLGGASDPVIGSIVTPYPVVEPDHVGSPLALSVSLRGRDEFFNLFIIVADGQRENHGLVHP